MEKDTIQGRIDTKWTDEDITTIRNGIYAHIFEKTAYTKPEPQNFIMRDDKGRIIGGLVGRIFMEAFYVELLWVDTAFRKYGFGSKLLKEAESRAVEKGCRLIYLDTFCFQAPEFYEKHGYQCFGVLEDYPYEYQRYYYRKVLHKESN